MVEEKITKKQLIPMIVGVLTMVLLVFGATYAYFSVTAGNTSGTTTITGDIGGDTLGTITLDGGNTELYLGISAYDMSETNKGKTYYSSTTEGSRETNVNSAGKTTYTATLSGDETDEVMYACDYEFTVTSSGTLLNAESKNDIEMVFNGDINKTINLTGTDKVSGTWYGFKKSNAEREFNAYLKLTNTEVEQNDLAGTNLSVEIENTKWNCYLNENDELVGEAYALYTEGNQTLTFVRSETPIIAGDTHNDVEVTEVYTGFEEESYTWQTVPWDITLINIIMFEDEIRPKSTANWFADYDVQSSVSSVNVTNLNTSLVTDMSSMFYFINSGQGSSTLIGIENWDTSNVTNMSNMFSGTTYELDLGNWDVSNVTYMSYMFGGEAIAPTPMNLSNWDVSNVVSMAGLFESFVNMTKVGDLSNWDTSNVENMSRIFHDTDVPTGVSSWDVSNVTDMSMMFENCWFGNVNFALSNWDVSNVTNMSDMFRGAVIETNLGISNWDVSSVTDMSFMFDYTTINADLNLSSWDISNVTNYSDFDDGISGTGTLTPPVWKNLYFGVYSEDDYSVRIYNDLDIPSAGDTYNGKTATKVYNISVEGSKPVSCSTTVVPTSIIIEDNIIAPLSTVSWFKGCTKVNTIDVSKLDTSKVTDMRNMFENVGSDASVTSMTITGIDSFKTAKVINMNEMFYNFGLNATYTLDLSGWDVSKITDSYGYKNFNYGVTTKVIAPIWPTS